MGRYVIRRLLQMIPVFIGTTFLIFAMVYALGDPVSAMFGDRAPDPATLARIRSDLNLDKPLVQQYALYMGNIFTGDFGQAFNGQQVTELMGTAFPVTASLTLIALAIEIVLGIGLGLITGLRRGRFVDTAVLIATLVVISIPVFVIGYLAQYFLGVEWGLMEPSVSSEATLDELIVPAFVLAGLSLAYVIRLTRTSIAENLRADYVRTAVAKGLPRRRVIGVHLLRNSLIPVVTYIGTDVGLLMGGAIVTERIFNIQGVGYQLYQGVVRGNSPTVVGFVTVLVIVFLLANLLVDLLYAVLDPRIRYVCDQMEKTAVGTAERDQAAPPDAAALSSTAWEKPRSLWNDAWRELRRNPVFIISATLILFLITIALWPGLFTSTDPQSCELSKSRQTSESGHPFGFDLQGCDVYARTLYGARASITVGVCVTAGVALLGGILGGLAGYFGGWWDSILSRLTDIFFGVPLLLGGLVFLSVIKGGSVWTVVGFMMALSWPQIARIARSSVITVKQQDYVQAARALGAGTGRILLRHILPNAVAPVIVVATIALGTYISVEATLSYLGVGLKPPTVSWGQDISAAAQQYRNAPHMLLWPAGALSVTVLSFIMLGDAVRDALDPKLR